MKRSTIVIAILLLIVTGLITRAHATETIPAAAALATGKIVLVAEDSIDLIWDPSTYPQPEVPFIRWELFRGTAANSLTKLTSGNSSQKDFYRDSGLNEGTTYYYRLDIIRCPGTCPPNNEQKYTVFSDSAQAGVFQGQVVRDLTLKAKVYEIGSGDVTSSASVSVVEGATLKIGAGTTVQPAQGLSHGGISAVSGSLQVDGATIKDVSLTFGDYYEPESLGEGWVNQSNLENGPVILYGRSNISVYKNQGTFNIVAEQQSTFSAVENVMTGGIDVKGEAAATIKGNKITNGRIAISGFEAQATPKARARVTGNSIESPYTGDGVTLAYGAQATVKGNSIKYTGFHGGDSSILLNAWGEGTNLEAERNDIINGKVLATWGSTINLVENVVIGEGSAITIGCILCGTDTQATGSIERNTVQEGWGFEMWAGSQELTIRHNCIRGNDPGLTTEDANMSQPVDFRYNWWGHESGPNRADNPSADGDRIDGNMVLYKPWDQTGQYCQGVAPGPSLPDLKVEEVRMVQVVDTEKTLVEAKTMAVKAVVSSDEGLVFNVKVRLTFDGKDYDQFYVLELSNLDKNRQLQKPSQTISFDESGQKTLYFFPDVAPFGNSATATVQIDPDAVYEDRDRANNSSTVTQPVVRTYWGSDPKDQTLRMKFIFGSTWVYENLELLYQMTKVPIFLANVMPIALIDYWGDLGRSADMDKNCVPGFIEPVEYLKRAHRVLKSAHPDYQRFVLATPGNWFSLDCSPKVVPKTSGAKIWTHKGAPSVVMASTNSPVTIMAASIHSLGGQLGKKTLTVRGGLHVPSRTIHDDGWSRHIAGMPTFSFMMSRVTLGSIYMDGDSYTQLINQHKSSSKAPLTLEAIDGLVLVSGTISKSGPATFDPIFHLATGAADPPGTGSYEIKMLDGSGSVLYTHSFEPVFELDLEDGPVNLDETAFSFALPYYPNTAKVTITRGGNEIGQLTISENSPSVEVTAPNGGENLNGIHTVNWTANDTDGGELTFAMLYSPDNGLNWTTLAMDLTGNSYEWDSSDSVGSENKGLIKVMVSDGYNTAEDVSDGPFSVANKGPVAGIAAPIENAVYTQGTLVSLEGLAYDLEEGWLDSDSLSWSSNRDGSLGSGSPLEKVLSKGDHVVTLTAIDSGGLSGSTEIHLTVSSETRPDLSIVPGSLEAPLLAAVCEAQWFGALVRNVVADASATVTIYDGDPGTTGSAIGRQTIEAAANAYTPVSGIWTPSETGKYQIFAVINDVVPSESNLTNNKATITVDVADGVCPVNLPLIMRP